MTKIIINTRAVISDLENKILFLKRSSKVANGFWNLPGGKSDPGQNLESNLIREVEEECGLEVSDLKLLTYTEDVMSELDGNHYFSFFLMPKIVKGVVRLNHESSDYKLIHPKDFSNYPIAFGHDKVIRDYFIRGVEWQP